MEDQIKFVPFPKIGRLTRGCSITEKIDGTNASVYIDEAGNFLVGSRTRWITPQADNAGFAKWAYARKDELMQLGPGHHFGEWWGCGIQRNYGLTEKRFSLFNTKRWTHNPRPECCGVVPLLYEGTFTGEAVEMALDRLQTLGSYAAPGFMRPEGIVIFHQATGTLYKKTLENDEIPKGVKTDE